MSCGKFSGTFSGAGDARTYRQFFALRWQKYITENFASPAHVAIAFGVDVSTAENWWAGSNAPQGWVVGRALADPAMRAAALHYISSEAA